MNLKEINSFIELQYAGVAMDYFYEKNNITPKIQELSPIPLESNWSLRPFFSGSYISRFRILQGDKEVSVVLKWFNIFEEILNQFRQPYYDILPLGRKKQDDFSNGSRFGIDQTQEIHDYIKNIFDNWD